MTRETRAAVLSASGAKFEMQALRLEAPRTDEICVRIVSAGVCHTDAVARAGDYPVPTPVVLGHEGAGVVEAVGSAVTDVAPGDHVVLSFGACWTCATCRQGRPALCQYAFERNFLAQRPDGSSPFVADGGATHGMFFAQSSFAEYALAPAASAVVVDKALPLELAGPLGCGIQTGAGAVLNSLAPDIGASIAVFGVGAVGLSAVIAAGIAGCAEIIAIDRHPSRLQLATELGATTTIEVAGGDVVEQIRAITNGGVEYALDTTGHPVVVRQAIDALRVAGTFGLIGAAPLGTEVSLDLTHMLFGRTFRGIIEGDSVPREFIPRLVEHYLEGRFPIDRLVQFYELDELEAAVHDSETGSVIKPVLLPGGLAVGQS